MRKRLVLSIVVLLALPRVAQADVGTPLLWATAFQLYFGNALIGLLEGLILAKAFGLRRGRCIALLLLANYISAWVGLALTRGYFERSQPNIYSALALTWKLVLLTYLLTLVLEWPLVALCFWRVRGWLVKSVKGSLLVQTVSYALLFGGFWLVSGTALYTDTDVVPLADLPLPENIDVFYIAEADGNVYRRPLDGTTVTKIRDLKSSHHWDYLALDADPPDFGRCSLLARRFDRKGEDAWVTVVEDIDCRHELPDDAWIPYHGWGYMSDVADSAWSFHWAHWPSLGLRGKNRKTGETLRVSFGTPFGGWDLHRALRLPGDRVLFQLGDRQICLLDVATRRVALFAEGRGVLAFERKPNPEPPAPPAAPAETSDTAVTRE